MGAYCDRCYVLCGVIEIAKLEQYDGHDLCPGCVEIVRHLVSNDIKNAEKLNKIGGLGK